MTVVLVPTPGGAAVFRNIDNEFIKILNLRHDSNPYRCPQKKKTAKKTPAKKSPKKRKVNPDSFIKRSGDLNKDGKVTRSEMKASGKRPATVQADLNNDGKVTRSEAAAFNRTKLASKKSPAKSLPVKKAIKKATPKKKSPAKKAPKKKATAKKSPAKKKTTSKK